MTEEQLDRKFSFLENLMAKASVKDMPGLTAIYNKLMDQAVEMDIKKNSKPKGTSCKKKKSKL